MIVNYTSDGWEIYAQSAHGLLAASIANEWHHSIRSERWVETLLAIAEHDDAQVELERPDLLTEQGGPMDFSMRKMEYEHCLCTMTRAYNKSLYIALLCSTHLDFLCSDANTVDNKVKGFMAAQSKQRKQWMKSLKMNNQVLERDYRLLEWCDALSLLLCQNNVQPEERAIDISTGPDDKLYKLIAKNDGSLTISPWPFQDDRFELYCEYRLVKQLKFKSADEFKKAYQSTLPNFKRWSFQRSK